MISCGTTHRSQSAHHLEQELQGVREPMGRREETEVDGDEEEVAVRKRSREKGEGKLTWCNFVATVAVTQ